MEPLRRFTMPTFAVLAVTFGALTACRAQPDAASEPSPSTASVAVPVLPAAPAVSDTQDRPFRDATGELGVDFAHWNGRTGTWAMPENMGGGGALADVDGDGDLDLLFVQGALLGPGNPSPADALDPPPKRPGDRLYRNLLVEEGAARFVDISAAAGLETPAPGHGMGAAAGDVDGDGRIDLYITRFGANLLLLQQGGEDGPRFVDRAAEVGVDDPRWSVPAVLLDYDADGFLDLYVGTSLDFTWAKHRPCKNKAGVSDYCDPSAFAAVDGRLFRNLGRSADGWRGFEDVTARAGLAGAPAKALGAAAADFNGDGRLDLYIASDGTPNQLWIQGPGGTFTDEALLAGCAVNEAGLSEASMGVVAADLDGDGDVDLVMTHLTGETHTVFRNDGRGNFDDVTVRSGLGAATLDATGFGLAALDVDGDGLLDLASVNGAVRAIEAQAQAGESYPFGQANQLFRGLGEGRFELWDGGEPFARAEVGRGLGVGDLDNDGAPDLVVFNNLGPARLLVNRLERSGGWLGVRAVVETGDGVRDAYGARIGWERSDGSILWRRVAADGGYAAASDPRVLFALDGEAGEQAVRVVWPGGAEERFTGLAPGAYRVLRRGGGA